MTFCEKCGTQFSAAYCTKCGVQKAQQLPPMSSTIAESKFCIKCGKAVAAAHCTGCGTSLALSVGFGKVSVFGAKAVAAGGAASTTGTIALPIPIEWLLMGIVLLFALSTSNISAGLMILFAVAPAAVAIIVPKIYAQFGAFINLGGAGFGLMFAFLATFTGMLRIHPVALVLSILGLLVVAFIGLRGLLNLKLQGPLEDAVAFLEGPMYFFIIAGYLTLVTSFMRITVTIDLWIVRETISANFSGGRTFMLILYTILLIGPAIAAAFFMVRKMSQLFTVAVLAVAGSGVFALVLIPAQLRRFYRVPPLYMLAGFIGVALVGLLVFVCLDLIKQLFSGGVTSAVPTAYAPAQHTQSGGGHSPMGHASPITHEGGFIGRIRSYGSSNMFLTGCILCSVGILGLFFNFSFGTIFTIAIAVLPVIGVWMVYAASKSPVAPVGTFPGLTLFKVSTIIGLVLLCIGLGGVVLGGIALLIGGAFLNELIGGSGGIMVVIVLALLIIIAIFIVWIKFYYMSLLSVLKSIKDGVMGGSVSEIKGFTPFMILSFISIGFGILGDLGTMAFSATWNRLISELLWDIPVEFRGIAESFLPSISVFPSLFSIAANVGLILLIVTLKQFADSIKHHPVG